MDEHVNKALFLGVALILFILAFTAFLTNYRENEAFLQDAMEASKDDPIYQKSSSGQGLYVTGDEMVHYILEKNRQDQEILLSELYETGSVTVSETSLPDIIIDGKSYKDCSPSDFSSVDLFSLSYVPDSQGHMLRIEFSKR